ncbi:alpha-xylosidase [Lentzea sp. NPDC004789]
MKFTDGYWRTRAGVRAIHPEHVRDVVVDPGSMTVHAPARRVAHRGATLNNPLVTITCSAPAPDVIAVRISHFAGQRPRLPSFPLHRDAAAEARIVSGDREASLSSGALTVRFDRGEHFGMEFLAAGEVLTRSGRRGIGIIETDANEHYVHEGLTLGVGETVYGLGERFGPLIRNGQSLDIWNADGGTGSELAYKNVPFYLTNRGYGVFVNHPGNVSFEVGSEVLSQVRFSVPGRSLEYLVVHGPTIDDVLRKYTALTGRPALPPAWSFGLWLSTSFITTYDQQTVTGLVDEMAERDLPFSVFHFDCFWMREFHWCDFRWDPVAFPRPRAMLDEMRRRGLRTCVWISPHIAERSELFAEGAAAGYLVRRPDGDVWQTDDWQAGMALVDFTNPDARAWYADKLRALLDMGVDAFKTDFGEQIPTDVVWHDGADPERMHNFYSYLYHRTVFDLLRRHRGEGEAVLFARSATAGGQQFPVHWGGDCESTFESMAESLRGGLSLAMSGFGFWSSDIGGFEGSPDPALFKRWLPFGLLCSHSRLHGSWTYRVPWLFDEESVDVLRLFTRLKARLMPYLYGLAVRAHREGVPVMRPMVAAFPDDPTCAHLDRQYLLGDRLLVAPVFTAHGETSYYVPDGSWTDFLTGARITGPGWIRETCGFDRVPLLVAPNSVIPVGSRDDRPDYRYADGVTLRVYEPADGCRLQVQVPAQDGTDDVSFDVVRDGAEVRVTRQGPAAPWNVLFIGHQHAGGVRGGSLEISPLGALVTLDGGTDECRLTLRS